MPSCLASIAEELEQAEEGTKELLAAGILPTPAALAPRPIFSQEAGVNWIGRPAGGRMYGTLVTDGSGMQPKWRFLRRAGWAVAMLDEGRRIISVGWGAVPFDQCPLQTSRDVEDYAVLMASRLCGLEDGDISKEEQAVDVKAIHIDCKGTLGCFKDKVQAASQQHARGHLWAEIWWRLPSGVQGIKMPAHVTWTGVRQGKAKAWQKQASDTVDFWAKVGAKSHKVTRQAQQRATTCGEVATAAAAWAGKQEAYLADSKLQDAQELTAGALGSTAKPRALKLPDRWAVPEAGGQEASQDELELALVMGRQGHKLLCGKFQLADRQQHLVGCSRCGAYATCRPEGLRQPCLGKPPTRARTQQRNDLLKGLHPQRGLDRPRLYDMRPATTAQLAWTARAWSTTAASTLCRPLEMQGAELAAASDAWSRRLVLLERQLQAFGGEERLRQLEAEEGQEEA